MSETGLDVKQTDPKAEPRLTLKDFVNKFSPALKRFLPTGEHPKSQWTREGFSVVDTIKQLKGPLIEMAGPAVERYLLVVYLLK